MDRKLFTTTIFILLNIVFTLYFIFKGGVWSVVGILHAVNFIFLVEEFGNEDEW